MITVFNDFFPTLNKPEEKAVDSDGNKQDSTSVSESQHSVLESNAECLLPLEASQADTSQGFSSSVSANQILQNDKIREGKDENIIIRIPADDEEEDKKPFKWKNDKKDDENDKEEFVLPNEKKDRQIDPGFGIGPLPGPDEGDEDGGGIFGEGEDFCACICFCDDEEEAEEEPGEEGTKPKLENAEKEAKEDDEDEAEDVIMFLYLVSFLLLRTLKYY